MGDRRSVKRTVFLIVYLVFAILPVYWMVNMSFKTNEEILSTFSLFPQHFTTDHYRTIFTDVSWYSGYVNSMIYVAVNTVTPAALFGDRLNQLDLRVGKVFRYGQMRATANVDLYNALNSDTVLTENSNFATWRLPLSVLPARFVKFSLQVDF